MGETPCGFESHPGHSLLEEALPASALPPIDPPRQTGSTLRDFLDLCGRARRCGRAAETARRDVHDPDRDRGDRRVAETSPTIASLDPAACVVIRVVERADRGVEPCGDLLCERLRFLGSRQQHEVIPADVPDETLVGAGGMYEDLCEHRDNAVAAREPIVVVEFLEPVDVDIEEREVLATCETRFELLGDRRIAG